MTQTAKKSPFSMNVDLMHGPIFKNLLLFMLPIFISSLFQTEILFRKSLRKI